MNIHTQDSIELDSELMIHKEIASYFRNERVVSSKVIIRRDPNLGKYMTFISLCIEQIGHKLTKKEPYLVFDINISDNLEIKVYKVEDFNIIHRENPIENAELKNVIAKLPLEGTIKNFMKKFKYTEDNIYNIGRVNSVITPYQIIILNIFECVKNLKDKYSTITFNADLNTIEVLKGTEIVLKGDVGDSGIYIPSLGRGDDMNNLWTYIIDEI